LRFCPAFRRSRCRDFSRGIQQLNKLCRKPRASRPSAQSIASTPNKALKHPSVSIIAPSQVDPLLTLPSRSGVEFDRYHITRLFGRAGGAGTVARRRARAGGLGHDAPEIAEREAVPSDPEAIATFIKTHAPHVSRLGLETGATAAWLWTELSKLGLPVARTTEQLLGQRSPTLHRGHLHRRPDATASRPNAARWGLWRSHAVAPLDFICSITGSKLAAKRPRSPC
jgi:hypothetical protein